MTYGHAESTVRQDGQGGENSHFPSVPDRTGTARTRTGAPDATDAPASPLVRRAATATVAHPFPSVLSQREVPPPKRRFRRASSSLRRASASPWWSALRAGPSHFSTSVPAFPSHRHPSARHELPTSPQLPSASRVRGVQQPTRPSIKPARQARRPSSQPPVKPAAHQTPRPSNPRKGPSIGRRGNFRPVAKQEAESISRVVDEFRNEFETPPVRDTLAWAEGASPDPQAGPGDGYATDGRCRRAWSGT